MHYFYLYDNSKEFLNIVSYITPNMSLCLEVVLKKSVIYCPMCPGSKFARVLSKNVQILLLS